MATRTDPRKNGLDPVPGESSPGREQARETVEFSRPVHTADVLASRPLVGDLVRAREGRDGRRLCLRIFSGRASDDADFRRELERIAKDLRGAESPAMLVPEAVETIESRLVSVLPFLPGRSLDARARDGALDRDALIPASAPLARALDALHATGRRHPEIHPGSIFVEDDARTPRLTDVYPSAWGEYGTTTLPSVPASLPFLSPEELAGGELTARSNVFSLAAVFYWALGGVHPHVEATAGGRSSAQHRSTAPALRTRRPDLPAAVGETLGRGLAADPDERPDSAGALVAELREALGLGGARAPRREPRPPAAATAPATALATATAPATAAPPRTAARERPRRSRLPAALLAAACVAGGGLGLLAGHRGSAAPSAPARAAAPVLRVGPDFGPPLTRLARDAPPAARRLALARGATGTATAARRVAAVYRTAARDVAAVEVPASVTLARGRALADLQALAASYDSFAAATRRGRRAAAVAARQAAATARGRTSADLRRLVRSARLSRGS